MNYLYLSGVSRIKSVYPDIERISVKGDIEWYAAGYDIVTADKKNKLVKQEIVSLTNKLSRHSTNVDDWDWHHVVEKEHIITIFTGGDYIYEVGVGIPSVLIHKPDHIYLSRNFNNNAFRELTSTSKTDLLTSPLTDITTREGREKLKARIGQLREWYNYQYERYPTFEKIANNVFDVYFNKLWK